MRPLFSLLVIVLSVGMYFVYIKPLSLEVRVQLSQKDQLEKVLNRVAEIKDKRDAVFSDYNSIPEEDLLKLNKILPESINSVVILNDLSTVASQYGLSVEEYKVDEVQNRSDSVSDGSQTNEPYKKTKMTMRLSGSYPQFLNFLTTVESSLRLIDVVFLNIKSGATGSNSIAIPLEYVLEANVYSLK